MWSYCDQLLTSTVYRGIDGRRLEKFGKTAATSQWLTFQLQGLDPTVRVLVPHRQSQSLVVQTTECMHHGATVCT
jgi:hypothetical protein